MPYKDPLVARAYKRNQMRRLRAANRERYNKEWRELRKKKKSWIDSQKVKCARCEEGHPACLDFHHRDPSEKDFLLSTAVSHCSLERIQAEAAKCDVLCANCHRKLHYEEKMAVVRDSLKGRLSWTLELESKCLLASAVSSAS